MPILSISIRRLIVIPRKPPRSPLKVLDKDGSPMGMGMAPKLHPDGWRGVWKKFYMTNFEMPNNISSMNYALKSVPGIADAGVPHGNGDGSRTPPRCLYQRPDILA